MEDMCSCSLGLEFFCMSEEFFWNSQTASLTAHGIRQLSMVSLPLTQTPRSDGGGGSMNGFNRK